MVVVAYNGGTALAECVESLLAQTLPRLEVVVVDNASSDGSIEQLEARSGPRTRVIRRPSNGGYAAGANTGWRSTDADVVAIVNQDLVFAPDCLERMTDALRATSGEALVTPKLVLKSDPTRVNAVGNDVHLSGVAWCHGLGTPADDWHGVVEVTAISGAAFMARRSFLESLGGLEEAYFMYYEDVDLSLRARLAGASCLAACDAVAVHDWSLALTPRKFELLERNRRAMWLRFWRREPRMLPLLMQAEAMGWAYAFLRGRRFIHGKWLAQTSGRRRIPLMKSAMRSLGPALSIWHPYSVMFPSVPIVQRLGGAVDTLVRRVTGTVRS